MITIRRPSTETVGSYLASKRLEAPTCDSASPDSEGFHHDSVVRSLGRGDEAFRRACSGLDRWAAHRGSGVEVFPVDAELVIGETVAVLTRQLGLWVLAACRVELVEDDPGVHGFTYATLPDHPECGVESFTVRMVDSEVVFEIVAISKPAAPLAKIGSPAARWLQKRATTAYCDAMQRWVASQD